MLKRDAKDLIVFLRDLFKKKIYDAAKLKDLQGMFIEHLDKYTLDHFLFEPVEVILMDDVDVNQEVKNLKDEIDNYDRMISDFIENKDGYPKEFSELGIDFSSLLYFSMGNADEVKEIEKKYSDIRRAKLEAKIAKKPSVELYIALVHELDKKKEAKEINRLMDKAVALQPSYKELRSCAMQYQDVNKKIVLYRDIIKKYPKVAHENYYWLADAYEENKEYKKALEYMILETLGKKQTIENHTLSSLDSLISKTNSNRQKIYKKISAQVKSRLIERELIFISINNAEYDKAFNRFYEIKDFLSDDKVKNWRNNRFIHNHIARAFLEKGQIEKGIKIVKDTETYAAAYYYYQGQKNVKESLYWYIKSSEVEMFDYHSKGQFASEKFDIHNLFDELYPSLKDFRPQDLVNLSEELQEEKLPSIAKKILIKTIERIKNNSLLAKANYLLALIFQEEGDLKIALKYTEEAIATNKDEDFIEQLNQLKSELQPKKKGFFGRFF